jgi:hypothetical protein
MNPANNKQNASVAGVEGIADPSERLGCVRDLVLSAVTGIRYRALEVAAEFPMLSVLRQTRAAIKELRQLFPTAEATLFQRKSQEELLKWLVFLILYDLGIINTNSTDLNVHVCLETERLSQKRRDELDELRTVLDSMNDWRLSHYNSRNFAKILRSSNINDRLAYQELCEQISVVLRNTLLSDIGDRLLGTGETISVGIIVVLHGNSIWE